MADRERHGGRRRTKRDRFKRAVWRWLARAAMVSTIVSCLGPILLTRR